MSEQAYYAILGSLILVFGLILLLLKILNPTKEGESQSGKAAHYQMVVLAIGLVIAGLIMCIKNF